MLYPIKFKPIFKDNTQGYIWGGRNLEKLGKSLPDNVVVGESWELSCHPNGVSNVANGSYEGMPLTELVKKLGRSLIGKALPEVALIKFPLLIKLIDANDRLSVQVHPDDSYAKINENGELGKNEMWYIIAAKPDAKLIYDVKPGTTKAAFKQAIKEDKIGECLKSIKVSAGDIINIPAGMVHAIGEGIMLAEVQQNSDTTYRIFDYNRVTDGKKRPLHVDKAIEVIDFNTVGRKEKTIGLNEKLGDSSSKSYKISNEYFTIEVYDIKGEVSETADGSKFYIYIVTEGSGQIIYNNAAISIKTGETVLIPAAMGDYSIKGELKALRAYVTVDNKEIFTHLKSIGYSDEEIYENVSGIKI